MMPGPGCVPGTPALLWTAQTFPSLFLETSRRASTALGTRSPAPVLCCLNPLLMTESVELSLQGGGTRQEINILVSHELRGECVCEPHARTRLTGAPGNFSIGDWHQRVMIGLSCHPLKLTPGLANDSGVDRMLSAAPGENSAMLTGDSDKMFQLWSVAAKGKVPGALGCLPSWSSQSPWRLPPGGHPHERLSCPWLLLPWSFCSLGPEQGCAASRGSLPLFPPGPALLITRRTADSVHF